LGHGGFAAKSAKSNQIRRLPRKPEALPVPSRASSESHWHRYLLRKFFASFADIDLDSAFSKPLGFSPDLSTAMHRMGRSVLAVRNESTSKSSPPAVKDAARHWGR